MTTDARTIRIEPESDLARALEAASQAGGVLVADTGEARYEVRVTSASTGTDSPSPEQVEASIAGIRAAAGAWSHVDADGLKDAIRDRRRTGSRPARRW